MPNLSKFAFAAGILAFFILSGCKEPSGEEKKIHWDRDGMMVIDGKRSFIIGSYHLPKSAAPYKTLAENGYNLIHTPADKKALDRAGANGLKAWITVGYIRESSRVKDSIRIMKTVHQYRGHPALLFWEMVDEPAFNWNHAEVKIPPEPLIRTCRLIRSIDPVHPVYTNHGPVNLVSTLQKYNPSTDVLACDIYPVIPRGIKPTYALYPDGQQGDLLNTYISQVGEYTDKMMRVGRHTKPVFMVLQGFAWEMLKPENERDSSMILYPTYGQTRYMAYDAIVHGANGVIYWGTRHTPQSSRFLNDLNRVTRELAGMKEILSSESVRPRISKTYHELRYSVDAGVEIMAKEYEGTLYLLTVNSDKNPVRVTLSGLRKYKKSRVLQENRSVVVRNGAITDDFSPFDVHIYQLER